MPHRARACLLSCMLTAAQTACRLDSPPTAGPLIRDSAGVGIVEYEAPPDSANPFAFSSRLYSYGTGLEDYAFRRIWRGVPLADGRAAVADAANREIVLIGSAGTFGGLLAGPGDGPGEINMVRQLLPTGRDSLLIDTAASYDWVESEPREGPTNPFGPGGSVTAVQ